MSSGESSVWCVELTFGISKVKDWLDGISPDDLLLLVAYAA
jgi:hypothetical protein